MENKHSIEHYDSLEKGEWFRIKPQYMWWSLQDYDDHHDFAKNLIKTKSHDVKPDTKFLISYKKHLRICRLIFTFLAFSGFAFWAVGSYFSYHPTKSFNGFGMMATAESDMVVAFVLWLTSLLAINYMLKMFIIPRHRAAKKVLKKLQTETYPSFFYIFLSGGRYGWSLSLRTSAVKEGWRSGDIETLKQRAFKGEGVSFMVSTNFMIPVFPLNPRFIFTPFNPSMLKCPKLYFKAPIDFGIDAAIYMIENNIKR